MTGPTPEQRAYADLIWEGLAEGLDTRKAVVFADEMVGTTNHAVRVMKYAAADFNEAVGRAWRDMIDGLHEGRDH